MQDFSNLVRISCVSSQATKANLNCGLWNARSLNRKIGALSTCIIENTIDIYLITETWTTDDQDPVVGDFFGQFIRFQISSSTQKIPERRRCRTVGKDQFVCEN